MTTAKAQTMQQRFGFQNKELTTTKHDEIMLWLDAWVETNINTLMKWDGVDSKKERNSKNSDFIPVKDFVYKLPDYPAIEIIKKIWEYPIVSKNYTIGFADMMVVCKEPILEFIQDEKSLEIYSYFDCTMYFEVKPSISSLGEVIRQIRMYQTYTFEKYTNRQARWFVVSPDTRFKAQLLAQGIGFVEATL